MTRQDFIQDVYGWRELKDFCEEIGCEACDDVRSESERDAHFNDLMGDIACNADSWQDLLSWLEDIPTGGYGYFIEDEYGEWEDATDSELSWRKQQVLEYCDDNELWEEEEVREEPLRGVMPATTIDDGDDFQVDESFSIDELFSSCSDSLEHISEDVSEAEAQEKKAFDKLIA